MLLKVIFCPSKILKVVLQPPQAKDRYGAHGFQIPGDGKFWKNTNFPFSMGICIPK